MTDGAIRTVRAVVLVLVAVTGNALGRRPLINSVSMTFSAFEPRVFPFQRKGCVIVIEGRISPSAGVVTGFAVHAELTVVGILRRVAGITIRRRASVNAVGVAGLTLRRGVPAGKRKGGVVVIEVHVRPFCGFMARSAVHTELTIMFVLRGVTGVTILRRAFIHVVDVAGFTGGARVRSRKRKGGIPVVERYVLPAARSMARGTDRAELSVVDVFRGMARITILRRAFIDPVDVTRLALDACMPARQRKSGFVVIEGGVLPSAGVMAGGAIRAELTVMRVPRGVTGKTRFGRPLENVVHVTGFTLHIDVEAGQREAGPVVIETNVLPGGRRVARAAVRTELSVVRVRRGVAGKTIRRSSLIQAVGVAGRARGALVTARQRESRPAVIKVHVLPVEGVMAARAILPHLPEMDVHVARSAGGRNAFEDQVLVTVAARDRSVSACELEGSARMIEGNVLPRHRLMTGGAILSQRAVVEVVLLVAGKTIRRGVLENIVQMASLARNVDVRALKFENRTVVIEMEESPAIG